MSASNWAVCPRCTARAKIEKLARARHATEAYGNVSQEEYQALVERSLEEIKVQTSFREDYEFYIANDNGKVQVIADYSGHCEDCGLGLDFRHVEDLYEEEA